MKFQKKGSNKLILLFSAIAIDEIEQKSQAYLSKLDNYVSSLDDESFGDSDDQNNAKDEPTVKPERKNEESETETSEESDEFESD